MERESGVDGFWDNPVQARGLLKLLSEKRYWIKLLDDLALNIEELELLLEMGEQESEIEGQMVALDKMFEEVELKSMLGQDGDRLGALLKINSGAGGTESNDWSMMLLRMYTRWGEKHGYKVSVYNVLDGDEAGIKSATVEIDGEFAYGYLKSENGVHCLF